MIIIDESMTAKGYTPAALVPAAFGTRRTIDEIVIHHWGMPGQSHDGVVNFFVNGPGQTSAHYVVSAGRIHCLVAPEDAAWHCPGKNATTIGIECRPEATDEDYATVAELIRTLRARYGNLPLSKHRDWYNTACPGIWDLSRLDALAGGSTLTLQSGTTITPLDLEEGFLMALSEDEQRRILAAADMALDTPNRPNPARLLNSADGGYIVALLEQVSGKVGATLTKEDGGYIVGLVSALKPGSVDPDAIAAAVISAVGNDFAKQVAAKITITAEVK